MRLNHKKTTKRWRGSCKNRGRRDREWRGQLDKKKRVRKGSKCVEGEREGGREGVSNKGGERKDWMKKGGIKD